jgi:hypothetical protein
MKPYNGLKKYKDIMMRCTSENSEYAAVIAKFTG